MTQDRKGSEENVDGTTIPVIATMPSLSTRR